MGDKTESAPIRRYMDEPGIEWRYEKPDYSIVNDKFLAERTKVHKTGSLEKVVEDLVNTWEMESGNKMRPEVRLADNRSGTFFVRVNGGDKFNKTDYITHGNYNLMLRNNPLYDAKNTTFETSQDLFRGVFKTGFAWEVLEVFSGPPVVSFTWRHRGNFEGGYKDTPPSGETIEMFGSCVAKVNDQLKIQSVDVYFDPGTMMTKLTAGGASRSCPF